MSQIKKSYQKFIQTVLTFLFQTSEQQTIFNSVGWGCKIRRLHLCGAVRPNPEVLRVAEYSLLVIILWFSLTRRVAQAAEAVEYIDCFSAER